MITYNATLLQIPGKEHVLKPDADGYYWVAAGALNAFNSVGMFYLLEGSKKAFDESSDFIRRVNEGSLYAEFGHPKQGNQSVPVFMQRVRDVYPDNVCCHIAKVKLIENGAMDQRGKPVCLITMRVKPWGPRAKDLESALQNGLQNVCFSIRCLAETIVEGGVANKVIREIFTFDFVLEPGIFEAKKRYSPALEDYGNDEVGVDSTEVLITVADIARFKTEARERLVACAEVALESAEANDQLQFAERLESYTKPVSKLPASSRW